MGLFKNGADQAVQQVAQVAQQALVLITQHMHDCELRAVKTDKRQDQMDADSNLKHLQNGKKLDDTNKRLDRIENTSRNRYLVLVTSMMTIAIGVAIELFLKK